MSHEHHHQNNDQPEADDGLIHSFFDQLYAHEASSFEAVQPKPHPGYQRPWLLAAAIALLVCLAGAWWVAQPNRHQPAAPAALHQPIEAVPMMPIATSLSEWQATTDYLLPPI